MNGTQNGQSGLRLQLFRMMQLIRRSQELLMEEYHRADEMRCPIHFCVGQEATPAALSVLLKPDDVVMSHHRSHGYYLAKGAPLDAMVAEFFGKTTGANGGLAGSQELSHSASGFYSGTILAGMFAMAAGNAFAAKYNRRDAITVGIIGDGGMEEGIVYETLNFASLFRLPVLFLCENNQYSGQTHIDRRSLSRTLVGRAAAFGVKTMLIDGNDVLEAHQRLTEAIAAIQRGEGPVFVEAMTYRVCGHVGPEGDDHQGYRSPAEILKWKARDPILLLREVLVKSGGSEAELERVGEEVDAALQAAIRAAKRAPFPNFDDALEYNASAAYDSVVTHLLEGPVSAFDTAQPETQVRPY